MSFIKKWVYGEFSLAKTYWLFGTLAGLILYGLSILLNIGLAQILIPNQNVQLYSFVINVWSWFTVFYALLSCVAIINSAGYNGKRTGWGWAATVLAIIGLFRTAMVALQLAGLMPSNFDEVSDTLAIENLALPVRIDEVTMLEKMGSDRTSKSIIYYYSLDVNIQDDTFFRNTIKQNIITSCSEFQTFFFSGAEKIIFSYKEPNLKTTEIILLKEECD